MQGIILAAGMGTRLKELTAHNTKCMIQVNGKTLIERMLGQLDQRGLSRIVLVVGYEAEKLKRYIATLDVTTPIAYIENPVYDKTNNIYSLALAKDLLIEDDSLLLESDLIFEDAVLDVLLADSRPSLALVDRYESWMDGTVVTVGEHDIITDFIEKRRFSFENIASYYKTVNIYKFSAGFSKNIYVPFLEAYVSALGNSAYYEQVLRVIALLDDPQINVKRLSGELWYEIDDQQDLDIAASMFADSAARINSLQSRYGGYWRYPRLLDFCYLVNPYFPPQRLLDEIKANFETLVTRYPSGMEVNALLVAKNFGIMKEHVAVGNGAAELIQTIMKFNEGLIGLIRPTFEEYPCRANTAQSVSFIPTNADFAYDADAVISFFSDKNIGTLVVVNPDNPSGNYLTRSDVLALVRWTAEQGIRFILDESFIDFADESDASLLNETILGMYPHLVLVKSISKSFGVPGLRLGLAACGDRTYIENLKKTLPVWNINSFAEFYLQIAEKYQGDYQSSLLHYRQVRASFVAALKQIQGIRPLPTQANFVMAELTGGVSSFDLTRWLFEEQGIFIKDLGAKILGLGTDWTGGQYVRFAIRDDADNARLIAALRSLPLGS
jgi:histidinol-phosphate/aromatic aminotransferase/cobyric acid decarboxylase-like protein/choline kinase